MAGQAKRECDCERYCRGRMMVSYGTWKKHAKYRNQAPLGAAEKFKETVTAAARYAAQPFRRGRPAADSHSADAPSTTASTPNASNKRPKRLKGRTAATPAFGGSAPLSDDDGQAEDHDTSSKSPPAAATTARRTFMHVLPGAAPARSLSTDGEDTEFRDHPSEHNKDPLDDRDDLSADPGSREDALQQELEQIDLNTIDESDTSEEEDIDNEKTPSPIVLEEMQDTQVFIDLIKAATLDNGGLDHDTVRLLREGPPQTAIIVDPDFRLGLDFFLSTQNASQESYRGAAAAVERRANVYDPPLDPPICPPTYESLLSRIESLTGVKSLEHDMCHDSCMAFTGPYADLDACKLCHRPRRDSKTGATRTFHTMPIGPQLQALWRHADSARKMKYRRRLTEELARDLRNSDGELTEWTDVFHGSLYADLARDGTISQDDMTLMFSIDGAQLYTMKRSDCWIFIWIVLDIDPEHRYKKRHILPAGFIGGPNKPRHPDSYLFPTLHHLAALQKEGLAIWDADEDRLFVSKLYLLFATADGPAMTYLNGWAGHHATYGCRLLCGLRGRHKPNGPHYYPALSVPLDRPSTACQNHHCDHATVEIDDLPKFVQSTYDKHLEYVTTAPNQTQYKQRRQETGISKASIFSALPRTPPIPTGFPIDLMHLASLNITDLMLGLFRGVIDRDKADKEAWEWEAFKDPAKWKAQGKIVEDALPYFPGPYHRPPRNPAEKINSGYKAWEYLHWFMGLGPGYFYRVLLHVYWVHVCKLIQALRIIHQRRIFRVQLAHAYRLLREFVVDFERLYYQQKTSRLHFVRQSIHLLLHLVEETIRIGPLCYVTQWPMERCIGEYGQELKQPSNPYANLSQRGVVRGQVNALKAMIPDLEPPPHPPSGSIDAGRGYRMLRMVDDVRREVSDAEHDAIMQFQLQNNLPPFVSTHNYAVRKWARCELPTGQIARTAWRETLKAPSKLRMSRNIKLCLGKDNGLVQEWAEVRFFFLMEVGSDFLPLAVVSRYTDIDYELWEQSSGALQVWKHARGEDNLQVIHVHQIDSVVAMVPLPAFDEDNLQYLPSMEDAERFFACEKMGLDVTMGGLDEDTIAYE